MVSREFRDPADLRLMLELVSELWPRVRWSYGFAFMAQRLPHDDWEARLWFDGDKLLGWAWSVPPRIDYEFRPGYERILDEALEWAQPDWTAVQSGDPVAERILRRHRYVPDPRGPWLRWNIRSLERIETPTFPAGYRLATMADYPDFGSRAAAHRSAFRPSRFTDEVYATVRRETPWRADLDCVVVDPAGAVAAYALAWLDERNSVGELEPVGVRRDLQRRGLGRAVCLYALQRLEAEGARTALVGSRGDDAYPAPRLLYESIGFREAWRNITFRRASG